MRERFKSPESLYLFIPERYKGSVWVALESKGSKGICEFPGDRKHKNALK